MEKILSVVLIGYGTGGSIFHAPFINACQGMKLAAVVTSNPERQKSIKQSYPHTRIYDSMEAMLKDKDQFHLAVITTPNRLHHDQAKTCLEAGLHVVVDKPFCLTAAQAEELITLAEARGKIVAPYHNRRFDSDFLTLKTVLDENLVGKPFRLESRIERTVPNQNLAAGERRLAPKRAAAFFTTWAATSLIRPWPSLEFPTTSTANCKNGAVWASKTISSWPSTIRQATCRCISTLPWPASAPDHALI